MEEVAILIDYKTVIPSAKILYDYLKPPTGVLDNFELGLVLILDNDTLKELTDLPAGSKRISYINKESFTKKIITYYYTLYNKLRNICILNDNCYKHLDSILKCIQLELDAKTTIWTGVGLSDDKFMEKIEGFVKNGFDSPYIAITNPMYTDIEPSVALMRETVVKDLREDMILNKIYYVITQYKKNKGSCFMNVKLTKSAVKFLKSTTYIGINVSADKSKKQKELSGSLEIHDVVKDNDKIVYMINVKESSVVSGKEEETNVPATRYNFHSHPHEAYIRHSVEKAWPSGTDYLAYRSLGSNTIFHCVASKEGVYILSFTSHWGRKLGQIDTEFIKKNFDIDHKKRLTPEQYVEKVNNIEYKGHPIYKVFFLPWDKATTMFTVFFPETNSSCIVSDEIKERYNKINFKSV